MCARLAVQLEHRERCEVWGEPPLRAAELEAGRAIASAQARDAAQRAAQVAAP
jgi:hypothetical protein